LHQGMIRGPILEVDEIILGTCPMIRAGPPCHCSLDLPILLQSISRILFLITRTTRRASSPGAGRNGWYPLCVIHGEVFMKNKHLWLLICSALLTAGACAQSAPTHFDGKTWWGFVSVLADDKMEGRETGSAGLRKAEAYIVGQ